jgi:anthranilate synthase component II
MRILLLDNFDSFTYNLYHYLISVEGTSVEVVRNNEAHRLDAMDFDKLVISPGPGLPAEAGDMMKVIDQWAGRKPILGVCLGHQALGLHFGARLINLKDVLHGVSLEARRVKPHYLLDGFPESFKTGHYHSWVIDDTTLPDCLSVSAVSADGLILAMHHQEMDICSVQFHPESVLTEDGFRIIQNFVNH